MYLVKVKKGFFCNVSILYKDWSNEMETYVVRDIKIKKAIPFFYYKIWIRKQIVKVFLEEKRLEIING